MKNIYFGIQDLEGDLFITISYDDKLPLVFLNTDDLNLVEDIFNELEIYEAMENVYQAPPGVYSKETLLNKLSSLDRFVYSKYLY